jgi:hypothetical protein
MDMVAISHVMAAIFSSQSHFRGDFFLKMAPPGCRKPIVHYFETINHADCYVKKLSITS